MSLCFPHTLPTVYPAVSPNIATKNTKNTHAAPSGPRRIQIKCGSRKPTYTTPNSDVLIPRNALAGWVSRKPKKNAPNKPALSAAPTMTISEESIAQATAIPHTNPTIVGNGFCSRTKEKYSTNPSPVQARNATAKIPNGAQQISQISGGSATAAVSNLARSTIGPNARLFSVRRLAVRRYVQSGVPCSDSPPGHGGTLYGRNRARGYR